MKYYLVCLACRLFGHNDWAFKNRTVETENLVVWLAEKQRLNAEDGPVTLVWAQEITKAEYDAGKHLSL